MGQSILVMEMWCPWKHPFFGLDVMGESTVGRDWLEGVHSEEVRRWENPLEKDLPGSIHSLREGNGRAHVKKGVSSYPVFRMDVMGQFTIGNAFEESTHGRSEVIGESFGIPGDLLGSAHSRGLVNCG